jgi:hypothetical protein
MKNNINIGGALFIIALTAIYFVVGCSSVKNSPVLSTTLSTPFVLTTTSVFTTTSAATTTPTTSSSSTIKPVNVWTLHLIGAINENIDQKAFEDGVTCHGAKWTDEKGNVWSGIALWYLAGYVDDKTPMGFNDALADKGYEIDLVDTSGNIVKFTSSEVKRNNNMLVAYQLNGQALSSTQWPLALVGTTVDQQRQISRITTIKLILP